MPLLRLFAAAREAAGVARVEIDAATVGDMLQAARNLYGEGFTDVLTRSRIWVNGQPAPEDTPLHAHDVVSVLPGAKADSGTRESARPADVASNGGSLGEAGTDRGSEELWAPDAPVSVAPGPPFAPAPVPPVEGAEPPAVVDVSELELPRRDLWADDDESVLEGDEQWRPDEPVSEDEYFAPGTDLEEAPPRQPEPVEAAGADRGPGRAPAFENGDAGPSGPTQREPQGPSGPTEQEPDGFGFLAPGRRGLGGIGFPPEERSAAINGAGAQAGTATVIVLASPNGDGGGPSSPAHAALEAAALRTSAVPVLALPEPDAKDDPKPEETPAPKVRVVQPLAVVPSATRPHARLGILWAVVTATAVVAGEGWLAAWLAVVAFIAGSQTAAAWKSRHERPIPLLAAAGAASLPVAAVFGIPAMTGAIIGAVVVTLLARLTSPTKAPARDAALTLLIAVAIGMAAAAPVLLRGINVQAAMLLLGYAAAYDAGAYLIGTGASAAWEGPVAGVFTLIPVSMLSAVVLVPPFPEASPLALGAVAAALAPFGPLAGSALLGDRSTDAPGLRRLDSLLVMGPVWAWCAAAFLQ